MDAWMLRVHGSVLLCSPKKISCQDNENASQWMLQAIDLYQLLAKDRIQVLIHTKVVNPPFFMQISTTALHKHVDKLGTEFG
jgi:hypothetical protein